MKQVTDECPECGQPIPAPRTCARPDCGQQFRGRRTDAIYCTTRCARIMAQRNLRRRQASKETV